MKGKTMNDKNEITPKDIQILMASIDKIRANPELEASLLESQEIGFRTFNHLYLKLLRAKSK